MTIASSAASRFLSAPTPSYDQDDDRVRVVARGEREISARYASARSPVPARLVRRRRRSVRPRRRRRRGRHPARSGSAAQRHLCQSGMGARWLGGGPLATRLAAGGTRLSGSASRTVWSERFSAARRCRNRGEDGPAAAALPATAARRHGEPARFQAGIAVGDTLVATSAELLVPLTSPLQDRQVGVSTFTDWGTVYNNGERLADQTMKAGNRRSVWFTAAFRTAERRGRAWTRGFDPRPVGGT